MNIFNQVSQFFRLNSWAYLSLVIVPQIISIAINIPILQAQELPPSTVISESEPDTETISNNFDLMPLAIYVGDRTVNPGTFVRGAEDGEKAIDFDKWLIAYDDVIKALKFNTTPLDNGKVELRSPGLALQIDLNELEIDDQLGMALSVEQIRELLGVPVEFDIEEYAIILNPDWLGKNLPQANIRSNQRQLNLEGLPRISAPPITLSIIGQEAKISGSGNQVEDYTGELVGIGTLFGGSWYLNIDQEDLTDRQTWKLNELQYMRQTPTTDYIIGDQETLWPEGSSTYTGFTAIRRFGFAPPITSSGGNEGFNPEQRLNSSRLQRDIRGRAEPGTLVQLVNSISKGVLAEQLVDSSGIYRFEDVTTVSSSLRGGPSANNYKLRLYPDGRLSADPEIREAEFFSLPGQLSRGTAALLISGGFERSQNSETFFGTMEDEMQGGVLYRWGATDNITLGTGLFYDQQLKGMGEVFFQPGNLPLKITATAMLNSDERADNKRSNIRYDLNVRFKPKQGIDFEFDKDDLSERFRANWDLSPDVRLSLNSNNNAQNARIRWRLFPGLTTNVGWDVGEKVLVGGLNVSSSFGNLLFRNNIDIDKDQNVNWNLFSRYQNLTLRHRMRKQRWDTDLEYFFLKSKSLYDYNHSLFLNLEMDQNDNNSSDRLATVGWRYKPRSQVGDRFADWIFDIGYGIGTEGSGLQASITTAKIPGLYVTAKYQNISMSNNSSRFSLQISSSAFLSSSVSFGKSRFERLRTEGGLVLIPFLDKNGNDRKDRGEKIYTKGLEDETAEFLFLINDQDIRRFSSYSPDLRKNGIFVRLPPDTYRFELDPIGIPLGLKSNQLVSAVEVKAGSYTPIYIPLTTAYALLGVVLDDAGNPVGGLRVEAIPRSGEGAKILSITNGAGIYYLESLGPGEYDLLINGVPAQPQSIRFDETSEVFTEIDLLYREPADRD